MSQPYGKPTLPHCADCGKGQPRVVGIKWVDNKTGAEHVRHEWLCASCEYKRSHPDAAPSVPMPHERPPLPLQAEMLFDA